LTKYVNADLNVEALTSIMPSMSLFGRYSFRCDPINGVALKFDLMWLKSAAATFGVVEDFILVSDAVGVVTVNRPASSTNGC
jgi:hypothetical protein